jgi:hypothetical protein
MPYQRHLPTMPCSHAAKLGHGAACPYCEGTGKMPGLRTGMILKLEREEAGVSRARLIPHLYKPTGDCYSMSYVVDLEGVNGAFRRWTPDLIARYRAAIAAAVQERRDSKKK